MSTTAVEIQPDVEKYRVSVMQGPPMKRAPFPIEHEQVDGFPPYAVMQRQRMLGFAAWTIRNYNRHAKRRCEVWHLLEGYATCETTKILGRGMTRAEKRLLADVTWSLWRARSSVSRWDIEAEGAALEDLAPALAASLAVRRIAAGSGEVLEAVHIAETRRVLAKGEPIGPAWTELLISALLASHEALRGQVLRGGMAVVA